MRGDGIADHLRVDRVNAELEHQVVSSVVPPTASEMQCRAGRRRAAVCVSWSAPLLRFLLIMFLRSQNSLYHQIIRPAGYFIIAIATKLGSNMSRQCGARSGYSGLCWRSGFVRQCDSSVRSGRIRARVRDPRQEARAGCWTNWSRRRLVHGITAPEQVDRGCLNLFTGTTKAIGYRTKPQRTNVRVYDHPRTPHRVDSTPVFCTAGKATELTRAVSAHEPCRVNAEDHRDPGSTDPPRRSHDHRTQRGHLASKTSVRHAHQLSRNILSIISITHKF
ncbi:hypothetical protein FQR65_LT20705 [Abscondita terminalis]|nr:hypothetical protein FQR65_LT20705 [Abscondita terminalis]